MAVGSRDFCRWLGIEHPVIQGPLGGATPSPRLVAAVSEAGGLGSLGAAYLSLDQIRESVSEIRRRTSRPFAVNLFAGGWSDSPSPDPGRALAALAPHHAALGLPSPEAPAPGPDPFVPQAELLLELRVPVFSFTFGLPRPEFLDRFKEARIPVMGTATTVAEAQALAAAAVDAVILQGSEAGGHRGSFLDGFDRGLVGLMALVRAASTALPDLPLVASGGIMDGRGLLAAEVLGAAAVQMGTAFLVCKESDFPEAYRRALEGASDSDTTLTLAFSGRPARGLRNRFLEDLASLGPEAILPYPLQNALTRPMRTAASAKGDPERLSLWAGQGVALARPMAASDLVRQIISEREAALRSLLPQA